MCRSASLALRHCPPLASRAIRNMRFRNAVAATSRCGLSSLCTKLVSPALDMSAQFRVIRFLGAVAASSQRASSSLRDKSCRAQACFPMSICEKEALAILLALLHGSMLCNALLLIQLLHVDVCRGLCESAPA